MPNYAGGSPFGQGTAQGSDFNGGGGGTGGNGYNLLTGLGTSFGIGGPGTSAANQLGNAGYNANPNLSAEQGWQNQQQMLAGLQTQQALGNGPSNAQAQLSSGINQGIQAQQAAAAGQRFGQNAGQSQYNQAQNAAGAMANGANSAAQLQAGTMLAGAQGLGNTLYQGDNGALGMTAAQQAAQNPVANLYGQEEGQVSNYGQNLMGSLTSGVGSLLGGLANGGITGLAGGGIADSNFSWGATPPPAPAKSSGSGSGGGGLGSLLGMLAKGGLVYLGEKGPEAVIGVHSGNAKLVDRPMLSPMRGEPKVVLPLKQGSAPYRPGALPQRPTGEPTRVAPKHLALKDSAKAALKGQKAPAAKQSGVSALSPKVKPVVEDALCRGGISAPGLASGGLSRPRSTDPKDAHINMLIQKVRELSAKKAA